MEERPVVRRRLEKRIKTLDSDVKCAGKEKNI